MNSSYKSLRFWLVRRRFSKITPFGASHQDTLMWGNFALPDPSVPWHVGIVAGFTVIRIAEKYPIDTAVHLLDSDVSFSWSGLLLRPAFIAALESRLGPHLLQRIHDLHGSLDLSAGQAGSS